MGKGAGDTGQADDYYADIAAVVCAGPVDELVSLIIDDKLVWPKADDWDASRSYAIDELAQYSGKVWVWGNVTPSVAGTAPPSGSWSQYSVTRAHVASAPYTFTVEGYGSATFYWGTSTQTLVGGGLLETQGHPNYRGFAVIELTSFLFGRERTSAPNLQVVVRRYPSQSIVTGSAANLDSDGQANPVASWCDLATDSLLGAGIASSEIDTTTAQALADALYADSSQHYLSPRLDGGDSFRAFTKDLLGYFDGWARRSAAGKIEMGRFLHDSAPPGGLVTLTYHDVTEEIAFETHGWEDTANQVFVRFTDALRAFKPGSAPSASTFNRQAVGSPRSVSVELPWVMRRQQASDIAAEHAKILSEPWVSGSLTVRAEKATTILPGELFQLTHDNLAFTIVARCTSKTIAEPPVGTATIAWEYERGLAPLPYNVTPASTQDTSTTPAEAVTLYQFWQPPPTLTGGSDNAVAVMAARTGLTTVRVKAWLKKDDSSGFFNLGQQTQWAVKGTLSQAYSNPGTSTTASRSRTSNVATITTSAAHGLATGQYVSVDGAGGTGYDGVDLLITVTGSTTFTYASTGSNEGTTATTTGVVTVSDDDDSERLQLTLDASTVSADRDTISETQTLDAVNDDNLIAVIFNAGNLKQWEIVTVKNFRLDSGVYKIKCRRARFSTSRRAASTSDPIWIIHKSAVTTYDHSKFESYCTGGTTATFRLQSANSETEADLSDTTACPNISYTFNDPYAPAITWSAAYKRPDAVSDWTSFTNFSTSYDPTYQFRVALTCADSNGDLAEGRIVAQSGGVERVLWAQTFSPTASVTKDVAFALPDGNWKIIASFRDSTGRVTSKQLDIGGSSVLLNLVSAGSTSVTVPSATISGTVSWRPATYVITCPTAGATIYWQVSASATPPAKPFSNSGSTGLTVYPVQHGQYLHFYGVKGGLTDSAIGTEYFP